MPLRFSDGAFSLDGGNLHGGIFVPLDETVISPLLQYKSPDQKEREYAVNDKGSEQQQFRLDGSDYKFFDEGLRVFKQDDSLSNLIMRKSPCK